MKDTTRAPWTHEQVRILDERQLTPKLHSYSCRCGAILRPTVNGWFCIDCDATVQDWCHTSDFTRWWEEEAPHSVAGGRKG